MPATRPLVATALLLSTLAVPLIADNRGHILLKDVFEGRRVTVRIDIPATSDGINVHVDNRRPLDVDEYRDDLRRHGVAIRDGLPALTWGV